MDNKNKKAELHEVVMSKLEKLEESILEAERSLRNRYEDNKHILNEIARLSVGLGDIVDKEKATKIDIDIRIKVLENEVALLKDQLKSAEKVSLFDMSYDVHRISICEAIRMLMDAQGLVVSARETRMIKKKRRWL